MREVRGGGVMAGDRRGKDGGGVRVGCKKINKTKFKQFQGKLL